MLHMDYVHDDGPLPIHSDLLERLGTHYPSAKKLNLDAVLDVWHQEVVIPNTQE